MSLEWYHEREINLFPVKKNGKEPALGANWRQLKLSKADLVGYQDEGYNIGCIVPDGYMVLDVDVRNGGLSGLRRLNTALRRDLHVETATAMTPTGGYHIWVKVPKGSKLRGRLDKKKFPGIDVKKIGGYILAVGSTINKQDYQWMPETSEVMEAPDELIMFSRKKPVDEHTSTEPGEFDGNDIETILSYMDPRDFKDREDWLRVAMACHYSTNGAPHARDAFIDWSSQDVDYDTEDLREKHRHEWSAFDLSGGVTTASLMHFVKEASTTEKYDELRKELFGTTATYLDDFQAFEELLDIDALGNLVESLPFGIRSFEDMRKEDLTVEFLIDGVLAKSQNMMISGVAKACKTSTTLDLAISLATGTPYLGEFNVKKKQKVLFLAAETDDATVREKLDAILEQKNLGCHGCRAGKDCFRPDDPCKKYDADFNGHLFVGNRVPKIVRPNKLTLDNDVDKLKAVCRMKEITILIIDPLYLALPSEDSSNLLAQGELFSYLSEQVSDMGVTLIMLHHQKKGTADNKLPTIFGMSGAGYAEFAGQWILLGRREEYENDGHHPLHMVYGGRAGQGGYRRLDLYEGKFPDFNPFDDPWREWEVSTDCGKMKAVDDFEKGKE